MSGTQTAARRNATATLTASTVDLVFIQDAHTKITVVNDTGTSAIWFTVSRPGGTNPVPTVNGNECFTLPAAIGSVDVRHNGFGGAIVQLISAGTPQYTVSVTE